MDRTRKITIPDFYGYGEHIYTDELGFRKEMKEEARSLVSREVFRYYVETVGLNLAFYDPVTDKFYGIHRENMPCVVKFFHETMTNLLTLDGNVKVIRMMMVRL